MKAAKQTKATLLEAATQVIAQDGALNLTLEAVAKQAGVSKGGLLYHFPNKDALVQGLLEYHLAQFEESLGASKLPFAQAYARLGSHDTNPGLTLALFTAVALNPSLLDTVRQAYRGWQSQLGGVDATVARLAADGLWLAQAFGLGVPKNLKQVQARIEVLAKENA
jgi:AcrR family transcriptional regulator